jgi:hypothetical protein
VQWQTLKLFLAPSPRRVLFPEDFAFRVLNVQFVSDIADLVEQSRLTSKQELSRCVSYLGNTASYRVVKKYV